MDPTAYDRWWKSRIQREDPDKMPLRALPQHNRLTALGVPAVASRLAPAQQRAEFVKPLKPQKQSSLGKQKPQSLSETKPLDAIKTKKLADYLASQMGIREIQPAQQRTWQRCDKVREDDEASSIASVESRVSYPSTPNFSQQSTVVDSEIIRRLDALEVSLQQERDRRRTAELKMKEILRLKNMDSKQTKIDSADMDT